MKSTTSTSKRKKSTKTSKIIENKPAPVPIFHPFEKVVQDWISKNPDVESDYYEIVMDFIYYGCFKRDFNQMVRKFGANFRERLEGEDLVLLETVEQVALRLIKRGNEPFDSVAMTFGTNVLRSREPFFDVPF